MNTILNLESGIKKSYYDHYQRCCEKIKDTQYSAIHKVNDKEKFELKFPYFDNSDLYLYLSKEY